MADLLMFFALYSPYKVKLSQAILLTTMRLINFKHIFYFLPWRHGYNNVTARLYSSNLMISLINQEFLFTIFYNGVFDE